MEGHTYGVTAWATSAGHRHWWRLAPGFALLRKRLHQKPGASQPLDVRQSGNDPRGHALLKSSFDLGGKRTLDLQLRHVARRPNPAAGLHGTERGSRGR